MIAQLGHRRRISLALGIGLNLVPAADAAYMRQDGELPMSSRSIHMPYPVGLASEFICYPDESDGLGNNLIQRMAVTVP